MIVELFSDLVQGQVYKIDQQQEIVVSSLVELEPIFDKLQLPPVSNAKEFQKTREGGLNVFLDHYSLVLRIFNNGTGADRAQHIYHTHSLPYIGFVRMPQISLMLMPGVKLCKEYKHSQHIEHILKNSFGDDMDAYRANIGYLAKDHITKENALLLDTVVNHIDDPEAEGLSAVYQKHLQKDPTLLLQKYDTWSDLQKLFYCAWISNDPSIMEAFWKKCEHYKYDLEQLHSGWQDLPKISCKQDEAKSASDEYHKKLAGYLHDL